MTHCLSSSRTTTTHIRATDSSATLAGQDPSGELAPPSQHGRDRTKALRESDRWHRAPRRTRWPHANNPKGASPKDFRGHGAARAMNLGALRTRGIRRATHSGKLAHATALRHTACAPAAQHCHNPTLRRRQVRPPRSLGRAPRPQSIHRPPHNGTPPPTVKRPKIKTLGVVRTVFPAPCRVRALFQVPIKDGACPLGAKAHGSSAPCEEPACRR